MKLETRNSEPLASRVLHDAIRLSHPAGQAGVVAALAMVLSLLGPLRAHAAGGDAAALQLARELAEEGSHAAAAIEYRRLALDAGDARAGAGYSWAAAYEYARGGERERAAAMLDRAEAAGAELKTASLLLRAEAALAGRRLDEARFYLQPVLDGEPGAPRRFAARKLCRAALLAKDPPAAKAALAASPADEAAGLAAIDRYAEGRDRKPWVGGLLGMVPGLGYAYSGEYANAVRSLILNGIFIWGMVDTAEDEVWGGFAAITFFELTWYTGSIYGGIDAAHRRNRERLDGCIEAVDGETGFSLERARLPIVSLTFRF